MCYFIVQYTQIYFLAWRNFGRIVCYLKHLLSFPIQSICSDNKDCQNLPPLSGGLGYVNEGLGDASVCGDPSYRNYHKTLHHSLPEGTTHERLGEEVPNILFYPGADRLEGNHHLMEERLAREESEKNYSEAVRRKSVNTTTWFRTFLSEVRAASGCSYELLLSTVHRWSVAEVVPSWFRPYLTEVQPAHVWEEGKYFETAFRNGVVAGQDTTSSSTSSSSSSSSSSLDTSFSPMMKNSSLLYGPDIYDFIELLHEVNIACSIGFRDHLEGYVRDQFIYIFTYLHLYVRLISSSPLLSSPFLSSHLSAKWSTVVTKMVVGFRELLKLLIVKTKWRTRPCPRLVCH